MKVRHIISTNGRLVHDPVSEPASGVVGAALGFARHQARMGNSVDVWGWNDSRPRQKAVWSGVRLWSSSMWRWARFARWDVSWLAPVWLHNLTQPPVDVLHAHVDPNLLYIPGARIRLLHLQTPVPEPFPPAYRRLLDRADAVICCSDFIRTRFLAVSGYPEGRTLVVHNGADPGAYLSADRNSQRTRWNLTPNDFVVLYSGAIVPEKGVDHLIRAFAQLQASVPNAVLLVAGGARLWALHEGKPSGDSYESGVRRLAEGLNVRFLGLVPRGEIPSVYSAADVAVIPSVWDDPHPTVVCEAMAAGRPVVASRAGGITETVAHGQTGFLVSPGDELQLSAALLELSQNERLRQQMGEAARERAKRFSWEASAERLDRVYQRLLAEKDGHKLVGIL